MYSNRGNGCTTLSGSFLVARCSAPFLCFPCHIITASVTISMQWHKAKLANNFCIIWRSTGPSPMGARLTSASIRLTSATAQLVHGYSRRCGGSLLPATPTLRRLHIDIEPSGSCSDEDGAAGRSHALWNTSVRLRSLPLLSTSQCLTVRSPVRIPAGQLAVRAVHSITVQPGVSASRALFRGDGNILIAFSSQIPLSRNHA
ncbi:hypothetical protein C8Q74DRAFT_935693 [Fomes fomentarius]|nr:hypothetical protein C8Q74DRAFT_935693 [Fomes fomentarius]